MLTCSCEAGRQTRSSFQSANWRSCPFKAPHLSWGPLVLKPVPHIILWFTHSDIDQTLLHVPQMSYMMRSVCPQNYSSLFEYKMSLVRIVAQRKTPTAQQRLFFPLTQKHNKQKKGPVYRTRGQIYSQSGSRVIRLDAFLEWSFLSLLLSFFEVSPRLPPLPQHSSLLFILYKYNQTGPWPTLLYVLPFCRFVPHTHTCTKTHIYTSRVHMDTQDAVDKVWWAPQWTIVQPSPKSTHTHFDTLIYTYVWEAKNMI